MKELTISFGEYTPEPIQVIVWHNVVPMSHDGLGCLRAMVRVEDFFVDGGVPCLDSAYGLSLCGLLEVWLLPFKGDVLKEQLSGWNDRSSDCTRKLLGTSCFLPEPRVKLLHIGPILVLSSWCQCCQKGLVISSFVRFWHLKLGLETTSRWLFVALVVVSRLALLHH